MLQKNRATKNSRYWLSTVEQKLIHESVIKSYEVVWYCCKIFIAALIERTNCFEDISWESIQHASVNL